MSAITRTVLYDLQLAPLFVCNRLIQKAISSLSAGVFCMKMEVFLCLLSQGVVPDKFSAEYNSLVYHIPVSTAHSSETNFPTIFAKEA